MFKTGYAFLLFVCLISACTDHEAEQVALQRAEFSEAARDSAENALVSTMDEINLNLDRIRQQQGLISTNNSENLSKKDEILHNISLINALVEDNRKKIELLNKQARQLGREKSALVRVADQTKLRTEKLEQEIATLKEQLAQESFKVADLNRQMDEMQMNNEVLQAERSILVESNAQLDRDLNKAYFAYGTYKELHEKGLVSKKGGVLGIGKKESLTEAWFRNKALFTELDIRDATTIPIQGRKPALITTHPEGSYEWVKTSGEDYVTLKIKNPEDFWSTSRFLIVEVK